MIATFVYDGDRRLVSKTEAGSLINFVRDIERVLIEADSDWATVAQYTVQGGGWYDPLVAMRRSGASAFYHFDALGSTNKLTDADAATLAEYLYRAFGADTVLSGTITNPYRFVAALGYYKTAASLLHLGARYYLPEVGRFGSRDRLAGKAPRGAYSYCSQSPVACVDPTGLTDVACAIACFIGFCPIACLTCLLCLPAPPPFNWICFVVCEVSLCAGCALMCMNICKEEPEECVS